MRSPFKAHLFILTANIIYGINYAAGKNVLTAIGPFGIVFIRVGSTMILFFLIHALFIKEKVDRTDHKKLFLCALTGVTLNQLLFFKGLSLTSEIHSSIIMITTPILVLIMGRLFLREKITLIKMAGIALGATGVLLLILSGSSNASEPSSFAGDICIMLNASFFAIFLVTAKPLMKKYSPITVAKWIFFYGFLMVIPFGISSFSGIDWSALSTHLILSLVYVVIAATCLAYLFNMLGLQSGDPVLVSIYIYTQPFIATAIAIMLHTDTISISKIISAIFVFAGVALVSFSSDKILPEKTVSS